MSKEISLNLVYPFSGDRKLNYKLEKLFVIIGNENTFGLPGEFSNY